MTLEQLQDKPDFIPDWVAGIRVAGISSGCSALIRDSILPKSKCQANVLAVSFLWRPDPAARSEAIVQETWWPSDAHERPLQRNDNSLTVA